MRNRARFGAVSAGMTRLLLSSGLMLGALACSAAPRAAPAGPAACPIIGSSEWTAWVDAMPSVPPSKTGLLIVKGKVTVPTGGYRIEWGDFRVAESYPVQVFADLRVIAPAGPATQAIVTHDVTRGWPMHPPVGSLTIRCGNRVLARIAPVETAY
jgi:hypothetical protein